MRRFLLTLLLAAGLATAVPAQEPTAEETALYEAAQASGRFEDYQAYLIRFPAGAYAEAARFELAFAGAEGAAAIPPGGITFATPLPAGPDGVKGRSIAELLAQGTPLFAPIEGLQEDLWRGKPCATCHQWTADDLCTQSKVYLRPEAADRLAVLHPLGLEFKQALKAFGEGGCRMK